MFMNIVWKDPAVQAAIIQAIGGVLAASIAAICAVVVGKRFADRRYLQERLVLAQSDIAYLLAVESLHCKFHTDKGEPSYKLKIREAVRAQGLSWSGKFTLSRSNARLTKLGLSPLPQAN